jgi:glutamate-1-semialdehyde 2,1-aminomutase
MEMMAPIGPVYQAGTLSGNPLVMTAGIETIKLLGQPEVYRQLETKSARLEEGIAAAASEAGISLRIARVASLLTAFFSGDAVVDFESAKQVDTTLIAGFIRQLLAEGIYWPPSQFEALFVSLAHSDEDIRTTIKAVESALSPLKSKK